MKQRAQECETDVNGLHSEIDSMRDSKMDTERKLNEIEQSLSVCKQQLISRGGSSQQHPADSQQVGKMLYTGMKQTSGKSEDYAV